ncbi:MAG: hypothetical protein LBQ60_18580 [Bacteroidales bacterium]|nr:hypothetical protein [Bacteroidales bacterium]
MIEDYKFASPYVDPLDGTGKFNFVDKVGPSNIWRTPGDDYSVTKVDIKYSEESTEVTPEIH